MNKEGSRVIKWLAAVAMAIAAFDAQAGSIDSSFPSSSLHAGKDALQRLLPGTGISSTEMIKGTDGVLLPFEVTAPGTLTVTLTDLGWPGSFSTLSFAALTSTSLLQELSGPGTLTFQLSGAGKYFAPVYGVTDPAFGIGIYSLNLSYAPVPLPAAPLLLISGLALAALVRKKIVINRG